MPFALKVAGPPPKLDVVGVANALAKHAAAVVRERVRRGVDVFDRPFAAYDADYAAANGAAVDLGASDASGLLATLRVTVEHRGDSVRIVVRPDPQHAKVGAFLQFGTPRMKARPWLGFSPRDLVVLRQRALRSS